MSYLFNRLMRDIESDLWNGDLSPLSAKEVQALCILLGIPSSGSKTEATARLQDLRDLRLTLSEYEDAPEDLCRDFRAPELKTMCKRAKLWRSGPKAAIAAGLLMWRNRCRHMGQKALTEAREEAKQNPRQLLLFQ